MAAENSAKVDYRALTKQVREQRRNRRTVRHPICLDVAMYDEWLQLQDTRRQEIVARLGRDDEPDPTARAGDLDTQGRIEALEGRMAGLWVVAVFLVEDPDASARRIAAFSAVDDDAHEQRETLALAQARSLITSCFDRFETPDGAPVPPEEFGPEDLAGLVADWTRGQILRLSNDISNRALEAYDIPLSVRQSLSRQR